MRHISPLALTLVILVGAATTASSQENARPSFAQRLASLRLGWGSDDEEKQSPREAVESASSRAGSASGERTGISARLPRLNPGDLLPGDRFTGPESSGASRSGRRPTSAHLRHHSYNSGSQDAGSARSRIMRDLRVQTSVDTTQAPRFASREPVAKQPSQPTANPAPRPSGGGKELVVENKPPIRAGSVLSTPGSAAAATEPPTTVRPPAISEADLRRELLGPAALTSGAKKQRADAETARSIAAAVASSMAEETASTASAPAEQPPTTEAVAAQQAPTEEPAAEEQSEEPGVEEILAEQTPPAAEPTPADATAAKTDRYAASAAPPIPAAPIEEAPADKPAAQAAPPAQPEPAIARSEPPRNDFDQQTAKRQFEAAGERSLEPRTAPSEPTWSHTPTAPQRKVEPTADADLLMSQRMPQIVSRVSGPKQIVIGREAVYRVTVANRGDETADQLATTVSVPEWAEVVGSRSTVGLVEPPLTQSGATAVLWKMAELQPGRTQHLDLKLVARQGRPIELGVNWKHAPVGSRTIVEVQEPKLSVTLDGPDELLFGKPQVYRLHVSNPGTGPAEDVRVRVQTPGSGATTHSVGDLLPNEARTIEMQVVGSAAGPLKLHAQAAAMGNLSEQAEKTILCRKPELEVDWRGPSRMYAGAAATYYFRVRNPGSAPAEGVEFRVNLPTGFEVTKASSNGRADGAGRQMRWVVGTLRPGDDYYMELQGRVNQPGANEFAIGAADAERHAASTTTATTEVIALADLKLEIRDPKGPLPVGSTALYEVRVRNRGTSAARQVRIVGLFSEGIEPFKVEGAQCSIADGRVAIRTVDSLSVGSELVLMIHAKAAKPGAHIFRAEVLCQDLDIKLAAEETTRFYTAERIDLGDGGARSAAAADRFAVPR